MKPVYLKGVAIIAPGLKNWQQAQAVFQGKQAYTGEQPDKQLSTPLSPNQYRRSSRTIQLALSAVQQLQDNYPFDSQNSQYVFSSCNGDMNTFHQISSALTMPGRPVSPTRFHNSVHNAPAGYCAIALQSNAASTSITAYEDSFAAGLLEASVQSLSQQSDSLLCSYDEIIPAPLNSVFPICEEFSCALLLSSNADQALCQLDITLEPATDHSCRADQQFQQLIASNPQAKAIPLLQSIACKHDNSINLALNGAQLKVIISGF